jgi:hypothetical protein
MTMFLLFAGSCVLTCALAEYHYRGARDDTLTIVREMLDNGASASDLKEWIAQETRTRHPFWGLGRSR